VIAELRLPMAGLNLAREFERIEAMLGASSKAKRVVPHRLDSPLVGFDGLALLQRRFDLTAYEVDLLLLCAGVQLDAGISMICREEHLASPGEVPIALARSFHPEATSASLSRAGVLRRWDLVEASVGRAGLSLRSNPRVIDLILGVNELDDLAASMASDRPAIQRLAPTHKRTLAWLVDTLETGCAHRVIVQFFGTDPEAQVAVAAHASAALGMDLYELRPDVVSAGSLDGTVARLWSRECALLPAALFIDLRPIGNAMPRAFADEFRGPLFAATSVTTPLRAATLTARVDLPHADERRAIWNSSLGTVAHWQGADLGSAASHYPIGAQRIEEIASVVTFQVSRGADPIAALKDHSRAALSARMSPDLADRIDPIASWGDLVLPHETLQALRQITAQVRNLGTVHGDWGFGRQSNRGRGISVLFAGESGTGKSMAAEVVATELGVDLYRVDLSRVVSKYIGETEKNLSKVFHQAESAMAVLLFDESDAIFGKRSEVRDSHDRYANLEVSYLLQRMETFSGLAILTTNARGALDRAFNRRLRFIIQFPFPALDDRREIWKRAFPAAAPLGRLDYGKLAALSVSGGSIHNIALNAAFRAAAEGGRITMSRLLEAAAFEFAKSEKPLPTAETKGWA
jgi:hypothetical protein